MNFALAALPPAASSFGPDPAGDLTDPFTGTGG
jgi:hypothetical protein